VLEALFVAASSRSSSRTKRVAGSGGKGGVSIGGDGFEVAPAADSAEKGGGRGARVDVEGYNEICEQLVFFEAKRKEHSDLIKEWEVYVSDASSMSKFLLAKARLEGESQKILRPASTTPPPTPPFSTTP